MPELLDPSQDLTALSSEQIEELLGQLTEALDQDRRENALRYYKPASSRARAAHLSMASKLGIGGGNGASKTETALVELIAAATGRVPLCEGDEELRAAFRAKFRGPIACRHVCASLTTVLHPVIMPKMRWYHWTGLKPWGGERGHWGWIPKDCLIDGEWSKSWSEKNRTLTVHCYDPDDPSKRLGRSTIQFMAHTQDSEDFASGDYDIVVLDEPPAESVFVENEARTMRVDGRIILSMTWPDKPEVPVDWIFDRLYDKAVPGSGIEWLELYTTDNPHLNQQRIAAQMTEWTETERQVRIYGRPIRFSNLIHPDFTDQERLWCMACHALAMPEYEGGHVHCINSRTMADGSKMPCGSSDIETFCHVQDFDVGPWPVVCLLDPHPRKPHMLLWVAIDPSDDWWVVHETSIEEHAVEVANAKVAKIEGEHAYNVKWRLMDPNMGRSMSNARTEEDWQTEFMNAGLNFNLAKDDGVGRSRVNEMMKVDEHRRQPRIHIHPRCIETIRQLKRYSWDEHKRSLEKDVKQTARQRYDDFPTLLKYLANESPMFSSLRDMGQIIRKSPTRQPHKRTHNPGRRKTWR